MIRPPHGWTGWQVLDGHAIKVNVMKDEAWAHILMALLHEPDPDNNHIHIKRQVDRDTGFVISGTDVVCSIKVDGMRIVNRRTLIDRVNAVTGLHLSYR